jgi:hypothetical protein
MSLSVDLKNIFLLNEKHQEEKQPLENRQLEGNISNPLANAVIFQEDVRTEEEWQTFDEEVDEPIIFDEGEENVR